MLAARTKKITSKRLTDPLIEDGQILAKLVCYTSKLVWFCFTKYDFKMILLIYIYLGTFMCGKSWINCNGSCS